MPPAELSELSTFSQTCFVARQPVFDAAREVFGYELLFRSGLENAFTLEDGDAASCRLIAQSLSVFGLDPLTGGGRAFINFTRDVLLQGLADLLPPSRVVVEILETVQPDAEVAQACRALKAAGYMIALDDFIHRPDLDPLVAMADILKVDFRSADERQWRSYAEHFSPRGITLLAEKVETWEEYRHAAAAGYTLFQGYFFCRPETVTRKTVNPSEIGYLRLLEELAHDDIDVARIERVIRCEPALAIKLLSYLNSAKIGCPSRISSIQHAVLLLGSQNLRRWAQMVAVLGLCDGQAPEVFVTCLVRAHFCELLGRRAELACRPFDLFLVGMLSMADAMMSRPLAEALALFSVSQQVREALTHGLGVLGRVYGLMRAYEVGNWDAVAQGAGPLGLSEVEIADAYRQALSSAEGARDTLKAARP